MPNTTWNPSDHFNGTLTNGNLTFNTNSAGQNAIRSIDRYATAAKIYFETTCTTWGSAGRMGVANAYTNITNISGDATGTCSLVMSNGAIYLNNVQAPGSPTLGARANGDIIGYAVDLTNKLMWFRVCPSGNWNGNAGYTPGGTGGVSIAAINPDGVLLPLYAFVYNIGTGGVITANFGDSAFSGAVPSGFTSGFPQNVPTLVAAETQIALEQWAMPNARAQVTQIAAEMWVSSLVTATLARQTAVTVN